MKTSQCFLAGHAGVLLLFALRTAKFHRDCHCQDYQHRPKDFHLEKTSHLPVPFCTISSFRDDGWKFVPAIVKEAILGCAAPASERVGIKVWRQDHHSALPVVENEDICAYAKPALPSRIVLSPRGELANLLPNVQESGIAGRDAPTFAILRDPHTVVLGHFNVALITSLISFLRSSLRSEI